MPGFNGRIIYPYEDLELSFKGLKKLLSNLALDKLKTTEKLDGFNVLFSFKNGSAILARKKEDILNGNFNLTNISNKTFAGGEEIKKFYAKALYCLEEVIRNMGDEEKNIVFGNGTTFYNAELLSPEKINAIKYDKLDKFTIIIHYSGHQQVDPTTNSINYIDPAIISARTDEIVQNGDKNEEKEFYIKKNEPISIKNSINKDDLRIILIKINQIMEENGLSDEDTILSYIKARVYPHIEKDLSYFSPEIKDSIFNYVISSQKMTTLGKLPQESKNMISKIKNNSNIIVKRSILPLEDIIRDFSTEILKKIRSSYISNAEAEIIRLKNDITRAIKTIKSSNDENLIDFLVNQVKKIKNHENIQAIEGIVFDNNGKTYKLTGNFGPVNQILGLVKYKLGSNNQKIVDKIAENTSKTTQNIAIIPGSFKPPHVGHYQIAKYFAEMPDLDKVFIIISPKERVGHSPNLEVTIKADTSLKIWQEYIKNEPKIQAFIGKQLSPINDTYEMLKTLSPGDTAILGRGEKDSEDIRFKQAQKWADDQELGINVKCIDTPMFSNSINATKMREFIANEDKEKFFNYLPHHLDDKQKEHIWNLVITKKLIPEVFFSLVKGVLLEMEKYQREIAATHQERKARIITGGKEQNVPPYTIKPSTKRSKSAPPGAGALEEEGAAAMSGGAVEGAAGAFKPMISRKEILEKMKLRNYIRESLKVIGQELRQEKEKDNSDRLQLRNMIRECLKEAKAAKEPKHANTGINFLTALLKKILPIIEEDYKMLTTSSDQRKSFRNHMIHAMQDSLTPIEEEFGSDVEVIGGEEAPGDEAGQEITGGGIQEDQLSEEEDQDIDLTVGDENEDDGGIQSEEDLKKKRGFIDINKRSKEKIQKEKFSVEGEDLTGRNQALQTFNKIEKNIIDSYNILTNEEDQDLFYTYLITNLKLYFDRYENEIAPSLDEPTNQEYEDKKDEVADQDIEGKNAELEDSGSEQGIGAENI